MDEGTSNSTRRVVFIILIGIAVVLGILLAIGVHQSNMNDRDEEAISDFNQAMQNYDMDAMSKCWDTSYKIRDNEMPPREEVEAEKVNEGQWHTWRYYKKKVTPFMKNEKLNRKLQEDASHITYDVKKKKRLSNGLFYVDVRYSFYSLDWIHCDQKYCDYLVDHQINPEEEEVDLKPVLELWYGEVASVEPEMQPSTNYREGEGIFLIKDSKIVAYMDDPDKVYDPLVNVVTALFPHIKEDAEKEAQYVLEYRAAQSQRETSGSSSQNSQDSTDSSSSSAVSGAYGADPSYIPPNRAGGVGMGDGTDNGGSDSQDNSSDEENSDTIDPDDHDIEGYYEDNKDDYEDEDDAYDGFMDDEDAWDDY